MPHFTDAEIDAAIAEVDQSSNDNLENDDDDNEAENSDAESVDEESPFSFHLDASTVSPKTTTSKSKKAAMEEEKEQQGGGEGQESLGPVAASLAAASKAFFDSSGRAAFGLGGPGGGSNIFDSTAATPTGTTPDLSVDEQYDGDEGFEEEEVVVVDEDEDDEKEVKVDDGKEPPTGEKEVESSKAPPSAAPFTFGFTAPPASSNTANKGGATGFSFGTAAASASPALNPLSPGGEKVFTFGAGAAAPPSSAASTSSSAASKAGKKQRGTLISNIATSPSFNGAAAAGGGIPAFSIGGGSAYNSSSSGGGKKMRTAPSSTSSASSSSGVKGNAALTTTTTSALPTPSATAEGKVEHDEEMMAPSKCSSASSSSAGFISVEDNKEAEENKANTPSQQQRVADSKDSADEIPISDRNEEPFTPESKSSIVRNGTDSIPVEEEGQDGIVRARSASTGSSSGKKEGVKMTKKAAPQDRPMPPSPLTSQKEEEKISMKTEKESYVSHSPAATATAQKTLEMIQKEEQDSVENNDDDDDDDDDLVINPLLSAPIMSPTASVPTIPSSEPLETPKPPVTKATAATVEDFEERTDRLIEHLGSLLSSIQPLVEKNTDAAPSTTSASASASSSPAAAVTSSEELSKQLEKATHTIDMGMKSIDRKSSMMVDAVKENETKTMLLQNKIDSLERKQERHEEMIVQILRENDAKMRKLENEIYVLKRQLDLATGGFGGVGVGGYTRSGGAGSTTIPQGGEGGIKKENETPTPSVSSKYSSLHEPVITPIHHHSSSIPAASDDYIKRAYPLVSKTPGTMFVTELTEMMDLDVGHHAILADIMDSQWSLGQNMG